MSELVRSWGGNWIDIKTEIEKNGYGFVDPIDKDPAKISVHIFHDLSLEFSVADIQDIARLIGSEPQCNIVIGIYSDRGSYELAEDFAKDVIDRFGGIYNYEGNDQSSPEATQDW